MSISHETLWAELQRVDRNGGRPLFLVCEANDSTSKAVSTATTLEEAKEIADGLDIPAGGYIRVDSVGRIPNADGSMPTKPLTDPWRGTRRTYRLYTRGWSGEVPV